MFSQGQFFLQCSFEERALPKAAGFRWDSARKFWYTPDSAVAVKLRDYGTESAKHQIDRLLVTVSPWTTPLPHPPEGLSLLPHQIPSILFSLERNRSYLGLDPGLGKTIIAARIAAALGRLVVYICPPFLTRNVEEEFRKWAPGTRVARYGTTPHSLGVQVLIVPDSIILRPQTKIDIEKFISNSKDPVLFVDEAHRYKNEYTKRTLSLFGARSRDGSVIPGIVDLFPRQIYMSGTPVPNRPMELYPILSKVAPETIDFMNKFEYGKKYCAGYRNQFGWDFLGASNVPELARRVIAPTGPFMLRLRKELLDLPPKLEEVFIISEDMSPRLAEMNMRLEEDYDSAEDIIKHQIATSVGKNADELPIATYRRILGYEKLDAACEYISSLLDETDESILVFAFHKDAIAGLVRRLDEYHPLCITGATPMGERHELVKQFQNDSSRRLMIGNYLAMGTGFTLTKATRVIFVEFSYVPGENDQASDRAHRIGQKGSVLVQYMVYADSIDKKVIETLLRKRKTTQQI